MNGNIFIDTNIAIYLLGGNEQLADLLDQQTVCLSFVTELELLSKPDITIDEEIRIKALLSQCVILDFFPSLKEIVIDFRKKYRIKLPDAIVAATAFALGLPLISADKGFQKVIELVLVKIEI